jgi:hypothetical protein
MMKEVQQQNQAAFEYLHRLEQSQFWGSIVLKFERGIVVHVRREENFKPSSLSEKPREHADGTHDR